ncbi:hypothetical protein ACT3CE_10080 [Marinifilum sp. RC60d5]|uniref:hypothetical protein n=1 Tax=Marinifilum sp. RC60d5 TaxID=3458414 RepID=UPI0040351D66
MLRKPRTRLRKGNVLLRIRVYEDFERGGGGATLVLKFFPVPVNLQFAGLGAEIFYLLWG